MKTKPVYQNKLDMSSVVEDAIVCWTYILFCAGLIALLAICGCGLSYSKGAFVVGTPNYLREVNEGRRFDLPDYTVDERARYREEK